MLGTGSGVVTAEESVLTAQLYGDPCVAVIPLNVMQ